MIRIDTIAQILQDRGLGTVGQDIFYFSAPETVQRCLIVLDNADETLRDESLPGYKKSRFRVVARDPDYLEAMTAANAVVAALDIHRETHGPLTFKRMKAEYDPIAFPVPDSDVIEVAINMWAAYTEA